MKKFIFALFLIQLFWAVMWQLGYMSIGELADYDRKLWIVTANLKYILTVVLYIAWHITPAKESK